MTFQPRELLPSATRLETALAKASPRITPRPMPVVSFLIYSGVLGLWLVLFARAFWLDNAFAWSVGVIYILYDSSLMALVGSLTWPLARDIGSAAPLQLSSTRPTLGVIIAGPRRSPYLAADLDGALRTNRPAGSDSGGR